MSNLLELLPNKDVSNSYKDTFEEFDNEIPEFVKERMFKFLGVTSFDEIFIVIYDEDAEENIDFIYNICKEGTEVFNQELVIEDSIASGPYTEYETKYGKVVYWNMDGSASYEVQNYFFKR